MQSHLTLYSVVKQYPPPPKTSTTTSFFEQKTYKFIDYVNLLNAARLRQEAAIKNTYIFIKRQRLKLNQF